MKGDIRNEMRAIIWNIKYRNIFIAVVLVAAIFLAWMYFGGVSPPLESGRGTPVYNVWPAFSSSPEMTQAKFRAECLDLNRDITIESLADDISLWARSPVPACRQLYRKFSSVYKVVKQPAPVRYPGPFQKKVLQWLGNSEELFAQAMHQNVIHVINKLTREHTVFNPIREKRPVSKPSEPERDYVERLTKESGNSCDFCNFKLNTAEDVFGRLETKLSYTASNAFKLGTWHGLFMPKAHHPLNWNKTQFMDLMAISLLWLDRAHKEDRQAQYPTIVWDMLPHAGASQIHPHLHGLLDSLQYQGEVENWRQAGEVYYRQHYCNYFSDQVEMASALGLLVQLGKAVAFPNIVPKKDFEVVIMSDVANSDFLKLLYITLRAFIDDLEKLTFSLGIGLPALEDMSGKIPAYVRVVSRGAVADVRTDMSSLELFAATNVNADPFKVVQHIQKSLDKRS